MKKLMTSTIIVLPLILLGILLVSGAIMSFTVHIYVDAVELSKKDTIILRMDDETAPPSYDKWKDEITILPLKATNKELIYSSEDESIVTIDKDGVIHAKFYGETYVTVSSKENKAITARRKVIVTDDKVHAIRINNEFKTDLYEGEQQELTATIYPKEAVNKNVKWSSSNPEILDVSASGKLTAVGAGVAEAIATSNENENIVDRVEITCHKKITGIQFAKNSEPTASDEITLPKITPQCAKQNKLTQEEYAHFCADIKYSYSLVKDEFVTKNEQAELVSTSLGSCTIKFLKPGKVKVYITATDFGGEKVEDEIEFVSTCGYFATTPLFVTSEHSWNEYLENQGKELPTRWLNSQLAGATKGVGEIQCKADGEILDKEILTYNPATTKWEFSAEAIECAEYIEFLIPLTSYNYATNVLVENEPEHIIFRKSASQSGAGAIVKLSEQPLVKGQPNELTISDLGENGKIELTISESEVLPVVSSNFYVGTYQISPEKVVLYGISPTENATVNLTIGVSVFELSIKVEAKADELTVNFNGGVLDTSKTYNTLLNELEFMVEASRTDKKEVTDKTIEYYNNNGQLSHSVSGNVISFKDLLSNNTITFRNGEITKELRINKISLADFGITITTKSNTASSTLATIGSVVATKEYLCRVPSDAQDQITLEITTEQSLLGGFGDNDTFKAMFEADLAEADGWSASYSTINNHITLDFAGKQEFNTKVALTYKDKTITLQFVRVGLANIEFVNETESFDMGKKEDIYLGYQQVRVFAKQSYYNGLVDYFRIPFNAISSYTEGQKANPEFISWDLSRVVGEANNSTIITKQLGYEVTSDGKTYTIAKDGESYVLKDNDSIVSGKNGKNPQKITWVDPFTEKEQGYARIYFGGFAGLEESDIQNDYFGNFAEVDGWVKPTKVEDDHSGRTFDFSENSFAFLRVKAGDGTEGEGNCQFNFNVLDDETLVNVFDVDGFVNNTRVVLHHTLYGPEELDDDPKYTLTLDKFSSSNWKDRRCTFTMNGKGGFDIIYGNGYQINLEAANREGIASSGSDPRCDTAIGSVYNAKILGATRNTTISAVKQRIRLTQKINNACYYYTEFGDFRFGLSIDASKGAAYIKNCLIRNTSDKALELYAPKAYVENIVLVDVMSALSSRAQDAHYYFKGNFDILNYYSRDEFISRYLGVTASMLNSELRALNPYTEWFGQDGGEILGNDGTKRYINLCLLNENNDQSSDAQTRKHFFWDKATQTYVQEQDEDTTTNTGELKTILSSNTLKFSGIGYNYLNSTDGGKVNIEDGPRGQTFVWYLKNKDYYGKRAILEGMSDEEAIEATKQAYSDAYSKSCPDPVARAAKVEEIFTGLKSKYERECPPEYIIDTATRDLNQLFSDERYIRLLCQYKTKGVPNDEHRLWHMQQIYRKPELEGVNPDHIDDLKNSLKDQNIKWPDGSTPDQAIALSTQNVAASNLYVILPSKKQLF